MNGPDGMVGPLERAREMVPALDTYQLTKDYGHGRGLFDLSLTVQPGEVFGFLGPNGAGKTTTIRLLMGMIHPTRGSAAIFGMDCQKESVNVKRKVGYVPGEMPQFGGLRGHEVVAYVAGLRGGVDPQVVAQLSSRFDLNLGRRFREYSRGNKQKLGLVLAFMHQPELLILDEPTGGLDPLNQQEFYRLVRETCDRGATVFLSSHILSEVEHLCNRIGFIRQGHLVQVTSLADLHHLRFHVLEIEFGEEQDVSLLTGITGVETQEVVGRHGRFVVHGSFDPLLAALAGHHIVSLTSREPSLEEVFLTYYDDSRREAVGS